MHHIYRVVGGYFRRKRLRWLAEEFRGCRSIVDFGGRVDMWRGIHFAEFTTIVNVEPPPEYVPATFIYVQRDARSTGMADRAFDLAFSNSAIEHVGSFDDQKMFANEMLRIG